MPYAPEKVVLRIIPAQAEWSVFVYNEVKMAKNEEKGEIVLYQPEGEVRLEVRVENETVWLTQAQMAMLFDKVPQNITIHIKNIYKEGELDKDSTCKEYLQVAHEGSNVLKFAAMRAKGVQAVVYSARITPEFKTAVALHNKQYPGLDFVMPAEVIEKIQESMNVR